jgi:hypothetical protein
MLEESCRGLPWAVEIKRLGGEMGEVYFSSWLEEMVSFMPTTRALSGLKRVVVMLERKWRV